MTIGVGMFGGAARLLWPERPGAFRLWLALVVVVHHITQLEFGKAPVLVFFALSGFWVQRVWYARYRHSRAPWLSFLISRWWRITPMLLLASGLSIGAHAWCNDADWALILRQPMAQALAPFTVVGYAQLLTRPVGPAWSLDLEIQFYTVVPLLIVVVARWRPLIVLGLGYGCLLLALTFGWGLVLPSFLIFFLLGMLAAQHGWRVPSPLGAAGMMTVIMLVALLWASAWREAWLNEGGPYGVALNLGLALCLMPFALCSVERIGDPLDRAMGDFSYLIYLLHWPAIILLRFGGLGQGGSMLAFAMMCLISLAAWRWVDRPLDRLRVRWVTERMWAEDAPCRKRGDSPTHFA